MQDLQETQELLNEYARESIEATNQDKEYDE